MSNSQVENTSAKALAEIVFYCEKRTGLNVPEGVDIACANRGINTQVLFTIFRPTTYDKFTVSSCR
ncbi:hypothetical protein GCM10028817_19240 [Spirosoma pomorum]